MGGKAEKQRYQSQDGLHRVTRDETDTQINVVFVHGLGGGAYSTWDSGDASELDYWPATLARDYPSCCVWTLHYTARALEWNPFSRSRTIDLLDKSEWFLDQLVRRKVGAKPIVFVTHSLGGVLVKQALQFSESFGPAEWRSIWERTQTVVFLATPHVGSRIADFALALARVLRTSYFFSRPFLRPSPALRHLEKNKPSLRYLRDWYRDHAPAQGIDTITYAEGRPLAAALVVDVESANPQIPNCAAPMLSDQDHISIAKPRARSDTIYERVAECLTQLEKRIAIGSVFSNSGEPVFDRRARTRLRETRDLVASLAGFWWQRVDTDELNHLSFFRISPDFLANSVTVGGRSYTSNGSPAADWSSQLARINSEQQKIVIKYFWTGKHVTKELAHLSFHGFGRMEFDRPLATDERIERARGGFWEVNESQPDKTHYKSIELRRITEEETVRKMRNGSTREKESRVQDTLNAW